MLNLLKALLNSSGASKKQPVAANTSVTDESGRRSSGDTTASSSSIESAPHTEHLPVLVRKACSQWKPGMPLTTDPMRPRAVCLFAQEKLVYLDLSKESSNNGETFAFLQDVNVENELNQLIQQNNNIDWLKKALFSYNTPFCFEPDAKKRDELDETYKTLCQQRVIALVGFKNNYQMLYDFNVLDSRVLPPLELDLQQYLKDKYPSKSSNQKIETYFNSVCNELKNLPPSDQTLDILKKSYQYYIDKLNAIDSFFNRKDILHLRIKSNVVSLQDTSTTNTHNILLYMVHHLGWTNRAVYIVSPSTVDEDVLFPDASYNEQSTTHPPIYLLHEKYGRVFYYLNEISSKILTTKPSREKADDPNKDNLVSTTMSVS